MQCGFAARHESFAPSLNTKPCDLCMAAVAILPYRNAASASPARMLGSKPDAHLRMNTMQVFKAASATIRLGYLTVIPQVSVRRTGPIGTGMVRH